MGARGDISLPPPSIPACPSDPPSVMATLTLQAVKTPAGHWLTYMIRIWMGGHFNWTMHKRN